MRKLDVDVCRKCRPIQELVERSECRIDQRAQIDRVSVQLRVARVERRRGEVETACLSHRSLGARDGELLLLAGEVPPKADLHQLVERRAARVLCG